MLLVWIHETFFLFYDNHRTSISHHKVPFWILWRFWSTSKLDAIKWYSLSGNYLANLASCFVASNILSRSIPIGIKLYPNTIWSIPICFILSMSLPAWSIVPVNGNLLSWFVVADWFFESKSMLGYVKRITPNLCGSLFASVAISFMVFIIFSRYSSGPPIRPSQPFES